MILHLFAGPGGFDVGCATAGHAHGVGLEWNGPACATRAAAGHPTIRTDVALSFSPDVVASPGYSAYGGLSRQDREGSVKITLAEAATLQSFPPEYPFTGNKSQQFQQVGNAVPPLLAAHVIRALTA